MTRFQVLLTSALVSLIPIAQAWSSEPIQTQRPCFVGSSMFMLANVAAKDPPSFYQLNLGYRLTPVDAVSLEVITWRYSHPLGIPYGPSFNSEKEKYPGYVRGTGAGLAYQRYWWKGLYSGVHATALRQNYQSRDQRSLGHGFQLLTTARLGYHLEFFDHRVFLEPSIAITYWPINTNAPAAFKALDDKWPSYFIGEPGLHVGVNF